MINWRRSSNFSTTLTIELYVNNFLISGANINIKSLISKYLWRNLQNFFTIAWWTHGEVQPDGAPGIVLYQQFVERLPTLLTDIEQDGGIADELTEVPGDRYMAPPHSRRCRCHVPVPWHLVPWQRINTFTHLHIYIKYVSLVTHLLMII